jgi:restriction system protein
MEGKMTIPDFQTLMLPLLKISGDGKEHSIHEFVTELAKVFQLTDQEMSELLPSGKQPIFYNRVG